MNAVLKYLRKNPSITGIITICLTIIEVHLNLVRYAQQNVIQWDIVGYYSYLPATFIEKDLKLSFINSENKNRYSGVKYAYVDDKEGHHVIKYSMGMAVLYAPFFMAAQALAEPLGYKADGYSEIYHFFIEFSGLFYLLFGLLYLRKLLLLYYSENITALTICVIFFGTNLLNYSTLDGAMSHAYTFSLFSVLLYTIVKCYKQPKPGYAVSMALLLGLIILIRPVNLLFALALLFFGVITFSDLKKRVGFFLSHYKHILLFLIVLMGVILPQLLYYKYVTGSFLVFSYGKEGFYFSQPHMIECLVGFRKGWFIYSPVFLFAMAGIWYMRKQASAGFYTMHLLLLPIYLYVVASWWCWWYGGSFSLRPMIDVYPLLALSLAACFYKITELGKLKRISLFGLLAFLVCLNIYQTFQYKYNIIHYDAMTARSYLNVFGKMDKKYIDTTLRDHPDYEKAIRGIKE